ncbi:hypothetical protein ABB02_01424 [Clostridiaceae bacterium JG1575]|nr:hypothetical protein ABB02_01424 [Clostridiaceae bacterium JG1575]
MAQDQFITGLDLGSYLIKASAITGRNGDIIFSAYGESQGIEDGVVTDSVRLLASIKSVLRQLELKTGAPVTAVFLNVDTAYTRQEANLGSSAVRTGVVTENDMIRAIQSAMRVAKGTDEEVCDVLLGDYKVDGVKFAAPVGVKGHLIDVSTQTILGDLSVVDGQARVLQGAGLKVLGTGLSVHGMANLMLSRSQRYDGVLMIDAGHRKTDVAVLRNNRIMYSETLPLGGRNITKDLSIILKISMREAEDLKVAYGSGKLPPSHAKYELIKEITTARMDEILRYVKKSFEAYPHHGEIRQACLYGGGLCGFKQIPELAQEILELSTNALTSDIMRSDDVFSLNATGVAYNMIHELQAGLIAQMWEDNEPDDPRSFGEPDEDYFSIFDKVRKKTRKTVGGLLEYDEDDEQGDEDRSYRSRTQEDFHKKASENSFKSRMKKLFGFR